MDNTEEEKVRLLESLRLQDAALSAPVDNLDNLDSDSDSESEVGREPEPVTEKGPDGASPAEAEPAGLCLKEDRCDEDEDEDDEESVELSSDPSWADALEANREYDAVLAQIEAEIKMNLAKVTKQLEEVHVKLTRASNDKTAMNLKSHWLYVFGMPYFKSRDLYPCPYNKDYHLKKSNNEICCTDLPTYHQWTPQFKKVLNAAVQKLSRDKCLKDAQLKLAMLRKEADYAKQAGDDEKEIELLEQINTFDVDALVASTVDDVIQNGDHDWLQISAKYMEGKQTPESCRNFWNLYLHPRINKSPYSTEEEEHLSALVEKYKAQNWDAIAKELGTNRSCYQCFIVYQNKLNVNIKRNWKPSEDKKLCELVEKFRIGDYVPWAKVAYYFEDRTKGQLFARWSYSLKPTIRKGRFTQEEDIMILVGVQMWGENFQRISHFLQDRTTCQIRDRYKHYLNRPDLGIPWTVRDDERLLQLVDQHGRDWQKISKNFPAKNRTQVRHRHNSLMKFKERHPDAPLTDAPSRCYNPQSYKDFQEHWDKAKLILNCTTVDEMVKAKNNLVSSLVKKKRKIIPDPKRKKVSIIEADLINYFRCSYELQGATKKLQLKSGEAEEYAEELALILSLLKANLDLPTFQELDEDPSLSPADREILKAFMSRSTRRIKDSPPSTPEEMVVLPTSDTEDVASADPPPLIYDENRPSCSSDPPDNNIDYTPSHDFAGRYIELPLMNFELDEVVADRNMDPSFYEAPTFDYIVPGRGSPPEKEKVVMLPPSLTSLVGLRTFLLNRRTLLNAANGETREGAGQVRLDKLAETQHKFDKRIWCLFLWPALMSRYPPSSNEAVFEEAPVKKNSFITGLKKPKSSEQITSVLSSLREKVLAATVTAAENNAGPSTSGQSKSNIPPTEMPVDSEPPKKRMKVVLKEEQDSDSDHPLQIDIP